MSKLKEEIKSYLNDNTGMEKQPLIKNICNRFNVKERTAEIYYYEWKKEFTGSNNCIPKEEKESEVMQKQEAPKEKVIIPHEVKPIKADEQEVFKKPKIKIITGKLEGQYGENEVADGGIKIGDKLIKSENELEEYKREELKHFYMMLGEASEILEMIN